MGLCRLRPGSFKGPGPRKDLFQAGQRPWGGEFNDLTFLSIVLLSFPKLLMQGSHTVNHLGCDHFRWPGMLTVFGSVHGKRNTYLKILRVVHMSNSAGSVHKTFLPKPFTKSPCLGMFLVAQIFSLLRKLFLLFFLSVSLKMS